MYNVFIGRVCVSWGIFITVFLSIYGNLNFAACEFCTDVCYIDSFIFLFLENYGVRKLEAVFAFLIATMAISFAWMFGETKPNGVELLLGESFLAMCPCSLFGFFFILFL